jgi:transposase-like protein
VVNPIRLNRINVCCYSTYPDKENAPSKLSTGKMKNFRFLRRIKKFRGISPEKIILHLRETEWRLNKISTNLKFRQAPRDEIKLFNKVSKDLYDELLEILRNNPL